MRLNLAFSGQGDRDAGPLDRVDERVLIAFAFGYVILVLATPIGAWRPLAIEAIALAFVAGFAGVSARSLWDRRLGFLITFAFFSIMAALAHPSRRELGLATVAASLLAKNTLALSAIVALVEIVPFHAILAALAGSHAPKMLLSTLMFMDRYIYVLTEELDRMRKARSARTFRGSGRLDFAILTSLLGVLLLRAWERGDRVHAAMAARGWDGTIRTLDRSGKKS